ncbi:MAG: HD domain-containing protein [Acetivibrio sp.]
MIPLRNVEQEYMDYITEFINSEQVKEMKKYVQHGDTSTYAHCLKVSYYSYKIAKKWNLNAKDCAIGGLLHDLFLYDWHDKDRDGRREFILPHGFTHGVVAERNARKYFDIDLMCSDIIITHMFPLTIWKVPKYKESYVVLMVDKYLSTAEVFRRKKRRLLVPEMEC